MREHEALVDALSRPEAWGGRPVEVKRTHASVVFLVGDRVYKIKRPVDLGFLDFSTPEKRRRCCEEEVRLNRRLAPGVYLGTVDLRGECAVEMVRLDDADTLAAHLERGTADAATMRRIARRLARFHTSAEARPPEPDVVAANARENFVQTRDHVGRIVPPAVFARLEALTEEALARLGPRFARRPVRDTHGDLRVDHVYLVGEEVLVLDCIEFNERFRFADPVSDLAFLAMDVGVRGHCDLARVLVDAWFEATGDDDGIALLDFYVGYRSIVRAKVAGLSLDVAPDALAKARRHWLYALACLEAPARRPALIGVGGLPGTGKSTVAAGLAREAGFEVIRSDVVRHELAGPDTRAPYGKGAYTESAKDHVYAVCLDRAAAIVAGGGRALIDASFAKERWREALVDRAVALGVPALILLCETDHVIARSRLRARTGDASDADEGVHARAVAEWEAPGRTAPRCRELPADGPPGDVLADALDVLASEGLAVADLLAATTS